MPRTTAHARLLALPTDHSPAGGRLDALSLEARGRRVDLVMDFQALELTEPLVLQERDGRIEEHVRGVYHPRRLRFVGANIEHGAELAGQLRALPPDDASRTMSGNILWRTAEGVCYFVFVVPKANAMLQLTARRCVAEPRDGLPQPAAYRRDWSPPPATGARLVPSPQRLRARYGGDPIAVRLQGRLRRRRLFIGGLDTQLASRPEVDVVFNVGDEASRWVADQPPPAADRWDKKGEGRQGMSLAEIAAEARWVAGHLEADRSVLVHCSAGMNRSATICCGALILLEGLSAEAALERVREQHPWARPDSIHWLALRWLGKQG